MKFNNSGIPDSELNVSYQFVSPIKVAIDLLKGLSLLRSYFHNILPLCTPKLGGLVVDLGGKITGNYYHKIILDKTAEIISTDLNPSDGVIAVDVEKKLPFADQAFDNVLAFWLFEHVYDLSKVSQEVFRILKPGGLIVISIPFHHQYHGDMSSKKSYDDFWRFSHTSLVRWWKDSGFECESIFALGEGLFCSPCVRTAFYLTPPVLGIRNLSAAIVYLFSTLIERISSYRPGKERGHAQKIFADGYLAVFRKPKQ